MIPCGSCWWLRETETESRCDLFDAILVVQDTLPMRACRCEHADEIAEEGRQKSLWEVK